MRKVLKALLGLVLAVVALAGGGLAYLMLAFPKVSTAAELTVEPNDELRARGKYLAVNLLGCVDCHSERDWSRFSGPLVTGSEGKGGERFGREMGLPGDVYASNITPAALGRYSDGELARAITEGVTKEGRAMFPIMPYPGYAKLCEKDLHAVMVHIRGLTPIQNEPGTTALDFPMNLIVRTIPAPVTSHPPCPDPGDQLAHGTYLASVGGCAECHSQMEKGELIPGLELAGGRAFPLPNGGVVRSANITPDPDTGLGKWDEATFVRRFKAMDGRPPPAVEAGAFNTIMPWTLYAGLTETDLKALFAYLKSVKPVSNEVERFSK